MSDESWECSEVWYSQQLESQTRSRLYPLNPLGIGTHAVESLTSYIARLAAAHRVTTGIFLAQEVAPLVSKYQNSVEQGLSQWFFRVFFNDTGAWNGTGVMASEPSSILKSLTKQFNLQFLTLLTWTSVLPTRGLLRTHKAWCPWCYGDWSRQGIPIHEPLLWSLKVVRICLIHQQFLQSMCPYCQRLLYPLEWSSRPGFCSRCQQWLGLSFGEEPQDNELEPADWEWNKLVVHSVGEILRHAPSLTSAPSRDNLSAGIDLCINRYTQGNISAFAKLIWVSSTVPRDWRSGRTLPQLGLLLRVCYCLSIPVLDFLTGKVSIHQPLFLKFLPPCQQVKKTNRRFDSVKVQMFLEAALSEQPPQSLRLVAAAIGYDPGDLSRFFPDLCHQISARYRLYTQKNKQHWV